VGLEHRLETATLAVAGEALQAAPQPRQSAGLDCGDDEQQQDGDAERDDDPAEIRRDGCVEIDRTGPPTGETRRRDGASILADGPARAITRGRLGAILPAFPTDHQRRRHELMAKRSRIAGRPGQRRPLQRSATRPAAPGGRPPGSVTPEEEARAAELEAAILAEERAAEQSRRGPDRKGRPTEGTIYSSVPLATRAAEEYGYVRRDVRRIALVGGTMLALLLILDVLVNILHIL
jgi:hypothetical protein